ncbi:39454_t:CDS:1, partial [Gigaspora margarita]
MERISPNIREGAKIPGLGPVVGRQKCRSSTFRRIMEEQVTFCNDLTGST